MKKILYIVSRFPALSTTFIDREIRALASAGYHIRTVSRWTTLDGEVSEDTLDYYSNTLYLDQAGTVRQFFAQLNVLISKPLVWFKNLRLIFDEKEIKNSRDRLRLLKHFIEAGYVYTRLRNEGISHIHAHFLNAPTSIALFLSRYLGIPYSFTMHGSNIHLDPLMLKTKLSFCKRAVTISQFNRKFLLDKYGSEYGEKIDVIHCGIDPHMFRSQPRVSDGPSVVLAVGRLIEIKGFRYLLEACRMLKESGLKFSCLIAGDGEDMEMLSGKCIEFGIGNVVTLLGSRSHQEVLRLLQDASVFVLPSIVTEKGGREGIPVALMEAMAMELPVVSTRSAGIPELVGDGREGLLVEHSNASELASAIGFLLRNPDVGKKMGKMGREKVKKDFNIADVPGKFHPVFD
jgi:colanic acid/amylovoran biosynthesis glycosyltransferase